MLFTLDLLEGFFFDLFVPTTLSTYKHQYSQQPRRQPPPRRQPQGRGAKNAFGRGAK